MEDAIDFLEDERSSLDLLPLVERRERAAKGEAGRLLLWLWNSVDQRNRVEGGTCTVLCWFLYAEDLESYVWKWILMEAEDCKANKLSGEENLRWRHQPLGSVVSAHLAWSEDGTANSALKPVIKAEELFGSTRRLSRTVPLVGIRVVLARALRAIGSLPCNPALYERCMKCIHSLDFAEWSLTENIAQAYLYPPTRLDPELFIKAVWSTYPGKNTYNQDDSLKKPTAQNAYGNSMTRAAFVSRLRGDDDNAEYLGDILQRHFPVVWKVRAKVGADLASDTKLQHSIASALEAGRDLTPYSTSAAL